MMIQPQIKSSKVLKKRNVNNLEIRRYCDIDGAFPSMLGKPFKVGRTPQM